MIKLIQSFVDRFFGKMILKLRLRSLHKYAASMHRLNKAVQRSDLSEDLKLQSAALFQGYVKYVALLSVGSFPEFAGFQNNIGGSTK